MTNINFVSTIYRLDDQIWGSDEEKDEDESEGEDEMNEETDAKGSKEDNENHNNLDSEQNDQGQGEDQDGLDATNGIAFFHDKHFSRQCGKL